MNKGLLGVVDASGGSPDPGAPRYGMLETIREYGLEHLAASGEEEAIRRAHAAWCVGQAERFWESMLSLSFFEWLDRIEADLDNLRAALPWLDQTGDVTGVLWLAGSLGEFWLLHSHRQEGQGWLERALDPARSAAVPATLRARGLRAAAVLAVNRGHYAEASALGTDCLALWRDLGDREGTALALHALGFADLAQGHYDQAVAHIGEAQAIFEALGNRWWAAGVRSDILGRAVYGQGDLAGATAILEGAVAEFREFGDPLNPTMALTILGFVACDRGDRVGAAARFAASLPLWRQVGARWTLADWLAGVATLAETCGASEQAVRLFGAADALCVEHGHAYTLPERASIERAIGAARAALGETAFAGGFAAGGALPRAEAIDEASAFLSSNSAIADPAPLAEPRGTARQGNLTPRELEVLRLLVEGRSDREIAAALFIGMRTVQSHAEHLYAKLGVRNRHEATAVAVRRGLV